MGYEQASQPHPPASRISRVFYSLLPFVQCITNLMLIANTLVWAHSSAAASLAIRGSFTLLVLDSINRADVTRMSEPSLEHASQPSPVATSESTLSVTQQASKCNNLGLRGPYWP
jgi:hypothetical protein